MSRLICLVAIVLTFTACSPKEPEKLYYNDILWLQYADVLGYQEVYSKLYTYITIEQLKDEWYLIKVYDFEDNMFDFIYTKEYYLKLRSDEKNAKIPTNANAFIKRNRLHFNNANLFEKQTL